MLKHLSTYYMKNIFNYNKSYLLIPPIPAIPIRLYIDLIPMITILTRINA